MKYRDITLKQKRDLYQSLEILDEVISRFKHDDYLATEKATNGCGWDRFEQAVSDAEFAFSELVAVVNNISTKLND